LYLPSASLGNYVWLDQDKDGVQDANESGISGVTVNLYDCSNKLIATTTTDGSGKYLFTDLTPGLYYVEFVPAPGNGYVFTGQDAGSNDETDSDANPASGKTECTTLYPGENDMTWDAGLYLPSASLGDYVWHDQDKDGVQNAEEKGIVGVRANLYECGGIYPIATTTTDATGKYLFTDLTPGDYYVKFVAPTGYVFTMQNQGSDNATDSDADSNGMTACTTLAPGENDMTWDAGLYLPTASLGDYVWYDRDKDGFQDADEIGIYGVTVNLYDCNDKLIATTTTDVDGKYGFTDLVPGDYYVMFEALPGYVFSPSTPGPASDPNDSDADFAGKTNCTTLEPDENDPTWDAGMYQPANCGLVLEKNCEVPSPPPGPFVCSSAKPIDALTMLWSGAETISIKAWKGAVGSTLLATIDNITPGKEVTVSGYAGSPNDVYWEIFSSSGTKIGTSTFHVSCSDVDMNGPEDCGKLEGNGKGLTGFINDWIFEGMAGNGQVLNCTPDITGPTNECVTQLGPVPDCTTAGKPTSLTFRYTGSGCAGSNNPQGGKAICTATPSGGIVDGPITVRAAGNSSLTSDVYGVSPTTVEESFEFTITFGGSTLKADSYVEIVGANGVKELNKIHTSCSQALKVGDIFGSLELVAFNGQTANNEVIYTYTLTNNGDVLEDVTLVDDKLGDLIEPTTLASGETKSYEVIAKLTETVTNTATATGYLPNGDPCSATATATVRVEVPQVPFVCSEAKPINSISMVWSGTQAVKIKAWKGAVGSTLLATIDNIKPGDEVTVTGYAGSPNDVYWEIFEAGTTNKIGTSTFHLSCSDADMNGSDDCGKYAGDGKGMAGFINDWLFAGMAGNGRTLDCGTVTPPPPPNINVVEAMPPTVDRNKFYWKLTNSGTDAAIITKVEVFAWPSQQGKLKKIKLDGDTAADPADIPLPPSTITVFSSDVQKKQIAAGQTRIFTIEFEKDYTGDTPKQYQFTITFEGGETLSWNVP